MSKMPRYAARRDLNEPQIMKALEWADCSVKRINMKGVADLLVGINGVNLLLETKSKRGTLTPAQEEFKASWHGHYAVVRSIEEALEEVDKIRLA